MQGSADLTGEAKAEFVQALALKPDLVPARMYLAQLYLDLGRAGSATETLTEGLVEQPGRPELLALLGEAERQRGNPRRAVELITQALQADESFAQGRYYLGLALADLGQRAEAIKELERVVQSGPKVTEAHLALGTAYIGAARLDDAVRVLREATQIDPSRAEIRIALARAYRSKGLLAQADEQLTLARPAATAAPASVFSQQQVEPGFYLELGLLRMRQRRLEAAAQAFQKVLDLDQNQDEAKQRLAEVRKLLQRPRPKPSSGGQP
jgi:tetratricopeptide (TPR) repeat protein